MDIFVEQMVTKNKNMKDYIRIVLCLIASFALIFAVIMSPGIPGIGAIVFTICVGLIYLMYRLICNTNLEYEYCFTNGNLDVDVIINARSRKNMIDLNTRKIEIMATRKNRAFNLNMQDRSLKKIYACTDLNAEDLCFMIYIDDNGSRKMLLFNPNEEIKEGIRRYNPQKVFLND